MKNYEFNFFIIILYKIAIGLISPLSTIIFFVVEILLLVIFITINAD